MRWDFTRPEEVSARFLVDLGRDLEQAHGEVPILLTTSDWVAVFIERFGDVLAPQFTFPRTEQPVVEPLGNKWEMTALAQQHGIPTPATAHPQSRDEVAAFAESARFPIVVKPADPYASDGPSKEVVHSAEDLRHKFEHEATQEPLNCILQEYIPGDATSVWMCNAYLDSESRCLAAFSGRKLRQVSSTGIASLAVVEPNPTVERQTTSFLQAVGYRGCAGVGHRYDRRDGLYKLLDINPRVSGVFRLFRAENGMDVVRVCYLDLTGQPIPALAPSVGRKWMIESDVFAAVTELREGSLTLGGWLGSLRGVREAQWLAADDPMPAVVWAGGGVRRRVSAGVRRARNGVPS